MSTTHENEGQNTACSLEHLATWPSLFSGLFTFALLSMLQPSGAVCGSTPEVDIGFLLRSSPIICLIDAVFVIWEYIYFLIDSRPTGPYPRFSNRLHQARKRLIAIRFQHELKRSNTSEATMERAPDGDWSRTNMVSDALNNSYVRWTVFVFSIPSWVKIYALRGVVGTQVLATMYLTSYVVVELMVVRPREKMSNDEVAPQQEAVPQQEKEVLSSGWKSLTYIAISINEILVLYCIAVAFRERFGNPGQSLHQWLCLTVLCFGAMFAIPLFLHSAIHSSKLQPLLVPVLLLVIKFIPPLLFTPFLGDRFLPDVDLSAPVEHSTVLVVCIIWVAFLLIFSSQTTEIVREKNLDTERQKRITAAKKRVELATGCFFLTLNVAACLLYYMFGYHSEGTYRPAWIEFLG